MEFSWNYMDENVQKNLINFPSLILNETIIIIRKKIRYRKGIQIIHPLDRMTQ